MKFFPKYLSILTALSFTLSLGQAVHAIEYNETTYLVSTQSLDIEKVTDIVESAGGTVEKAYENFNVLETRLSNASLVSLSSIPEIFVEDVPIMRIAETTTPTANWALDRVDQQDLPLTSSYTYNGAQNGAGVKVYIVDTGVYAEASQLAGRILPGYDAITSGGTAGDCHGHGTHVAANVAGKTVGIAPGASIVPVRVIGCTGNSVGNSIINGLAWVLSDIAANPGPAVVNISLGTTASVALDNAVTNIIDAGIPVVVAAGNSSSDACEESPGRVSDAITVAASSKTDQHATFSNFGPCVDIYAPGVNIWSASNTSPTGGSIMSGTSMSAPHVAGVIAKYLSVYSGATPAEMDAWLIASSSKDKLSLVPSSTPNRLLYSDPAGIEELPVTLVQNPPTNITAMPSAADTNNGTVEASLTWIKPKNSADQGTVTDYKITVFPSTGVTGATTRSAGNVTNYVFSGLTLGVDYTFTVTALNALGESLPSSPISFKEVGPPSQVSKLSAAAQGYQAVRVWIAAPTYLNGGTVSSYTITATPQTGSSPVRSVSVSAGTTAATISNLVAGVKYTITAHAITEQGVGVSRTAGTGVTAWGRPSAPRNVAASYPSALKTWVSWTIPETTYFAPLVRYEIRWTTAAGTSSWSSWTSTGSSRGYTVNGLPKNQTRYVEVRMVSGGGTGAISRITVVPKN